MSFNKDIVGMEKPDGICSLTFVLDEFSGSLSHQSFQLKVQDLQK